MNENSQNRPIDTCNPFDISDDDVLKAMKDIDGYLDITPSDFKALYGLALAHAVERLTRLFKARDVMTKKVIYVERDTPSEEVAHVMATHGVSGVPVLDEGRKVVGVISEKDFLFHFGTEDTRSFMDVVAHCLRNKGCLALSMRKQMAEDFMTSPAITVSEETLVSEIANILTEKNISRVPVTDPGGKVLGIVARADIIQTSCPLDIKTEDER